MVFNTWMWSFRGDRRFERVGTLLGGPLGRVLYERFGLSVHVLWRHAVSRGGMYSRKAHRHYVAALNDPRGRHATWVYARELLGSSDWYDSLWQRRARIADVPALLVWGMKDPAFASFLPRWRTIFNDAEVVEVVHAGHAPPEESPSLVVSVMQRFLCARP